MPKMLQKVPYRSYLKTKHWSKIRSKMLKKYDRRCGICGSGDSPNVHHVDYGRLGHEEPSDMIVLCRDCHQAHHDGRHEYIASKLGILQLRGGIAAKAKEIAEMLVPCQSNAMSARHRKRKRDYTARDWRRLIGHTESQLADEVDTKKQHVLSRRISQAKKRLHEMDWVRKLEQRAISFGKRIRQTSSAVERNAAEAKSLG